MSGLAARGGQILKPSPVDPVLPPPDPVAFRTAVPPHGDRVARVAHVAERARDGGVRAGSVPEVLP